MKRSEFRAHLRHDGYWYVIAAVICIFVWMWVFGLLTAPKKEETVFVFIASYGAEQGLSERLNSSDVLPSGISEVNITYEMADEPDYIFYTRYSSALKNTADIVILPQSRLMMFGEDSFLYFCELPQDWVTEKFADMETVTHAGAVYGIKVYDAQTHTGVMTDVIDYLPPDGGTEEDYYLLFPCQSVHVGTQISQKAISDSAVLVAERICKP